MDERYQYKPLKYPWLLRVIEILPGERNDPICCHVFLTPGGDAHELDFQYDPLQHGRKMEYSALSYTWGDSKERRTIWLDWRPIQITANLFTALQQLRHPEGYRLLWIDAISINQEDTPERNYQVRRMTSIYENAKWIHIWLGPEADNSDLAMDLLIGLGQSMVENKLPDGREDFDATLSFLSSQRGIRVEGSRISLDQDVLLPLVKLLKRAWWTRVWIVQEASVLDNSRTFVYCGDKVYNFLRLFYAVLEVGRLADPRSASAVSSAMEGAKTLWTFMTSRNVGGEHLHLINLLIRFRHHKATDNRDKVYGLIGMVGEVPGAKLPPPSYEKSIEAIYCEAAQYIINTSPYGQTFDILGYADDFDEPSFIIDDDLPGDSMSNFPNLFVDLQNWTLETNYSATDESAFEVLGPLFDGAKPILRAIRQSLLGSKNDSILVKLTTKERGYMDFLFDFFEKGPRSDDEISRDEKKRLVEFAKWFKGLESDFVNAIWQKQDSMAWYLDPIRALAMVATTSQWLDRALEEAELEGLAMDEREDVDTPLPTPLPLSSNSQIWPSWVPDWRRSSTQSQPFSRRIEVMERLAHVGIPPVSAAPTYECIYYASGQDKAFISKYISNAEMVSFEGSDMLAHGFRIDTIKELKSLFLLNLLSDPDSKALLVTWLSTIIGSDYNKGSQPERIEDALSRTLEADVTASTDYGRITRLARSENPIDGSFTPCEGRLLAITQSGFLGLVPLSAEVSDEIYLLAGGQVFYVLRPHDDHFRFIGESYVHGLMDGEAMELLEKDEVQLRIVRIK
jgi:hypothetical protein